MVECLHYKDEKDLRVKIKSIAKFGDSIRAQCSRNTSIVLDTSLSFFLFVHGINTTSPSNFRCNINSHYEWDARSYMLKCSKDRMGQTWVPCETTWGVSTINCTCCGETLRWMTRIISNSPCHCQFLLSLIRSSDNIHIQVYLRRLTRYSIRVIR